MYRIADVSMRKKASLLRRMSSTLQKRVSGTLPSSSAAASCRVNTFGYEAFTTLDPSCRQQHQLASSDYNHREAMRLFLESLNAVLLSSQHHQQRRSSSARIEIPLNEENNNKSTTQKQRKVLHKNETIQKQQQVKRDNNNETTISSSSTIRRDLNTELTMAIRRKNVRKSISLFEEAIGNNHLVDKNIVVSLFYQVSKKNPVTAYDILQYYNLHPETSDIRIDMYRRLCNSVSQLDPKSSPQGKINKFIESLLTELDAMDNDIKEELYPNLVASFAAQRSVSIGPFAGVLYSYMVENEFDMAAGWLNKLLSSSKYNRQGDLPFHDILAKLVEKKDFPHPLSSLPAIHNMFPYTDTNQMRVAINALLDIKQSCIDNNNDNNDDDGTNNNNDAAATTTSAALYKKYSIDMSTIEMISTGAANSGDSELTLLLWDLLEVSGFTPTEHIYENTVIAFACSRNGIYQAFSALATMKEEGFEISRALIRSFSRAIRSNRRYVDKAFRLLTDSDSTDLQCLENFNVIMSSYAERGDVNETMRVLSSIKEHGFEPNQDSYSFAMEVLGKDLHRRKSTSDRSWVHKNIEIAGSILTTMEENGVAPSGDVVRNYVELLCMGGELATATALIEDCLTNDKMNAIVNNKTLYRVAVANAEAGNIETAKKMANLTSETIEILHRKIRSKEQRFVHLENMQKLREKEAQDLND